MSQDTNIVPNSVAIIFERLCLKRKVDLGHVHCLGLVRGNLFEKYDQTVSSLEL